MSLNVHHTSSKPVNVERWKFMLQNHFVASDELLYYLQAVSTMHEVKAVSPLLVFDLCDVVQAASHWWNRCNHDSIPLRIEHHGNGLVKVFTTSELDIWPLLEIATQVSL